MRLRLWIEEVGGRRFTMALGAGVATSVLVWFSKITPEVYQWTVLGTVGAYIAGNTVQKVRESSPGKPVDDEVRSP